jgi:hypothetical protein
VVQALLRQRQQSVDLVELAAGRSDDTRALALAASVLARAEPELDRLQELLWRWRADAAGGPHDHDGAGLAARAGVGVLAASPPFADVVFRPGRVACTIPTGRVDDLAGLRGRSFDVALGSLLRRHEVSAARASRVLDDAVLGREAAAAVRRAVADQQAVLTELLNWPTMGSPTTG